MCENAMNGVGDSLGNLVMNDHVDNAVEGVSTAAVNSGLSYATDGIVNIGTVDAVLGTNENPNWGNVAGNSLKGFLEYEAGVGFGDGGGGGDAAGMGAGSAGSFGSGSAGTYSGATAGTGYDIGSSVGDASGAAYPGDMGTAGAGLGDAGANGPSGNNSLGGGDGSGLNNRPQMDTANSWLDSLSGAAKTAKPYITAGQGIYNIMNAMQAKKAAQQAATQANAERAPYVQQLQQLMANPNGVLPNTPGYQAGLQAVQRSQSAQGYQGSGNMMAALQQYGGNAYSQQAQMLSQLAGKPYDPNGVNALNTSNISNDMMNQGIWTTGLGASGK